MNIEFLALTTITVVLLLFCTFVVTPVARWFARKTETKLDDLLVDLHVVSRLSHLLPVTVFSTGLPEVMDKSYWLFDYCDRISNVWYVLVAFSIACAFLDVFEHFNDRNPKTQARPVHGIFQAIKLTLFCVGAILVTSQVSGKSPVLILSALGAVATVLMLIFRDSILGVVAGVQINVSDLLRKGDWIEIDRHGADGSVIDITLTSVKVRNWDKTISVIPAYDLITNSFKNWRGMEEAGCRRIKRSLFIDVHSIRFLTEDEIERLKKIDVLKPYLDGKMLELEAEKNALPVAVREGDGSGMDSLLNKRHLTNIGTFRAYCSAYLRTRATIAQNMTLMTRLLAPTPMGLPLEIYAFVNDIRLEIYEGIQSDIFDHLIAAMPEFGLKMYQRE